MKSLGILAVALLCSACGADDEAGDSGARATPEERPTAVVTKCRAGDIGRLELHVTNPLDVAVRLQVYVAFKVDGAVVDRVRLTEDVNAGSAEDMGMALSFRAEVTRLVCDVAAVDVETLSQTRP